MVRAVPRNDRETGQAWQRGTGIGMAEKNRYRDRQTERETKRERDIYNEKDRHKQNGG